MQKNTMILTLLLVVGVAGLFAFAYYSYMSKQNVDNSVGDQKSGEVPNTIADTAPQPTPEGAAPQVNGAMNAPEGAVEYILSSAEAKYSVMKTYFGKPAVEVVGSTKLLAGSGWFDEQTKKGAFLVNLKFTDVKTDSPKRDQDITPLFSTPDIVLKGEFDDLPPFSAQPAKVTAPVSLTINGVTKEVPMSLSIVKTMDGSLQAEGTGAIKMSDFNVKAPSLLNVFSVADDVKLSFTMQADQKSSQE